MKTSLEHRRNNAYLAYKLSGTDWARNFWRKTYELLEYKYVMILILKNMKKLMKGNKKMKARDIEMNTIELNVNFILEDNSVVENCSLNSGHLSDTTITKIFDDLSKIDITKYRKEKIK
jgi:hypothetical protein